MSFPIHLINMLSPLDPHNDTKLVTFIADFDHTCGHGEKDSGFIGTSISQF